MSSEEDASGADAFSDESEEEQIVSNKRKRSAGKKKKRMVNQFIEEEADDDEDDDDEFDDDNTFENEKGLAEEAAVQYEENHRRLNQERKTFEAESAEDIVNRIKQKHRKSQRRFEEDEVGGEMVHSDVTQQSLLPSVSDPKMWIFKCKPGREQYLILSLMHKYVELMNRGTPLHIKSAVASSSKGFIYVEAVREPHAKEAVTGLRDIMPWSMKLVPIQEMSSVMTIKSKKKPLLAGSWARIKRAGLYKGDLCKVLEVLESGTRAVVQMIPRLDSTVLAGGIPQRYTKGQRPSQNLFVPSSENGNIISRKRFAVTGEMMDIFDGDFYKDGFLMKDLNINTMLTSDDIVPTLDEMNKFSGSDDAPGVGTSSTPWAKEVELAKGDTVRVIDGDLANLMGVVVGTNAANDTVKVMPLHEEIRDTILDFQLKQLMKFVKIGDHVKVISGRYVGETGTVVSVDESGGQPIAIVLADSMAKEIQVRVRDVQESAEISTGFDSLKGKELYDLVALPHGDVGVITHVGRESFKVIMQNGQAKDVTDQEIQRKLQSSRAAALDKQKNHITPGEMVSVVDGTHKGQTGTIKHLYRSFVFLHNNKISDNAGIFVVKSRLVVLAGSRARSTIAQNSMPTANGARPQRQQRPRRDDRDSEMIGKTVKIKKGRHKGYLGMVVEESETKVKVEIHSKSACVEVDKQHILLAGTRMGQIQDNPRTSATPMIGQTPMSAQTPLHSGAMTPMHTPMHHSGGMTPTPHTPGEAWNPAAKQPADYHEAETPFASSYATPMDPVTPHQQEAATPGTGFYNPATPGAFSPAPDPSTPGLFNPTTPGISMATPGGYQLPRTPGMIMAPLTPAISDSPMPATPFGGAGHGDHLLSQYGEAVVTWAAPHIEVRVIAAGESEGLIGSIVSVQENGVCLVDTGNQTLRFGADALTPVIPEKHNRIRVLQGDGVGQTGSLIGTDGDDGIVKMDGTAEINIYNLSSLAKLTK